MDNLLLTTEPFLTGKPLEAWLNSMGIRDWSINAEGLVDVNGSVDLQTRLGTLKRLPVRFGRVGGNFFLCTNQLVSLEGAPEKVGENFWCDHNQLVSLEGAPKEVGEGFWCCQNQLTSLEGAPKAADGNFYCEDNRLVSLEGAPEKVGGSFDCYNNQLESLEGAPKEVGGDFYCSHNLLVDFKGLEGVSIGKNLIATNRRKAEQDNIFVSLEGLPKELYSKVIGLDIPVVLELERKRAASLLGDEVAGLSSEVELG